MGTNPDRWICGHCGRIHLSDKGPFFCGIACQAEALEKQKVYLGLIALLAKDRVPPGQISKMWNEAAQAAVTAYRESL